MKIHILVGAIIANSIMQALKAESPPPDEVPGLQQPKHAHSTPPKSTPWWVNPPRLAPDPNRLKSVDTLINTLDRADRNDRLERWEAIYAMAEGDPIVAQHLKKIATTPNLAKSRYARFVAAANTAGFGFPTQIGPNRIAPRTPLFSYIELQKGIAVPSRKKRLLSVDRRIAPLKIDVAPNAKDDLYFQEILWIVIEKYNLEFRTAPDGTFCLIPVDPAA